jgi:hypothetical protein
MGTTVTTPWGKASVVEEIEIEQVSGERAFASIVQLLEAPDGERLVRFAYRTDGVGGRGPVTLRPIDLERLRIELRERRELARTLGLRPR